MDKNNTILLISLGFFICVLFIATIYVDYKNTRSAIENGLEECQIDLDTRKTMWVKNCDSHLKIVAKYD